MAVTPHEGLGVWDQRQLDCFFNSLSGITPKSLAKLCILAIYDGNLSVIGRFPSQRVNDAESDPHRKCKDYAYGKCHAVIMYTFFSCARVCPWPRLSVSVSVSVSISISISTSISIPLSIYLYLCLSTFTSVSKSIPIIISVSIFPFISIPIVLAILTTPISRSIC